MHPKPPSRTSQVVRLLHEAGAPLPIGELARKLSLPEAKIRQSVGDIYNMEVVRVGDKLYDLPERAFVGKTFRYTPSQGEIQSGKLEQGTDLLEILTLGCARRGDRKVTALDSSGKSHTLKVAREKTGAYGFALSGLKPWYAKAGFAHGDDILFTCTAYSPPAYRIERVPKGARDEAATAQRNSQLADLVFRQLLKEVKKFCHVMFLVRKYVFLFPFNDSVPPDSLFKALAGDPRFLVSKNVAGYDGKPMHEWIVGIRKYFFEREDGVWIEVSVTKDEFGSFGSCTQCWERLIWNKENGWQHVEHDWDLAVSYLTPEFFNFDRRGMDMVPVKFEQTKLPKLKPEEESVAKDALPTLEKLFGMALERFLRVYTALGFNQGEYGKFIEPNLGDAGGGGVALAFMDTVAEALHRNPRHELSDMNSLAREFQALDNHFPFEYEDGRFGSAFLENVVDAREEHGRHQPENIPGFVELVLESHRAVDAFAESQRHGLATLVPTEEAVSVCHHALDWYFMAAPHLACKQNPKKAAAIAMFCMQQFNDIATEDYLCYFGAQEVADFAGYKTGSSVSQASYRAFYDILYAAQDVALFLFNQRTAPASWRQRLKVRAPGLDRKDGDLWD